MKLILLSVTVHSSRWRSIRSFNEYQQNSNLQYGKCTWMLLVHVMTFFWRVWYGCSRWSLKEKTRRKERQLCDVTLKYGGGKVSSYKVYRKTYKCVLRQCLSKQSVKHHHVVTTLLINFSITSRKMIKFYIFCTAHRPKPSKPNAKPLFGQGSTFRA